MKKSVSQDSRGVAHLILIVGVVIVLGVIGFAGMRVMKKSSTPATSETTKDLAKIISEAKCEYDDKDLCKFLTGWKETKEYKVTSETTAEGKTSNTTYESKNDKFHMSTDGEFAYEIISIGNDTYTKATDGTWWKQTTKPAETTQSVTDDYDYDFKEPDAETATVKKTEYKKIGKEACDKLTCFKYEVVETDVAKKQFIWFDDKDYQLRRMRDESADSVSDQKFAYSNVTVEVPSPVKVLGPNQYLVPGQSEPTTIPDGPSAEEMQQYMNSLPADSE